MATLEDEESRKRVQEAVWSWAVRVLVLAVAFGFGFFASWILYGSGPEGAPAVRQRVTELDAQILELKNKRVDTEGKLTVVQGRLDECNRNLAKAVSKPAGSP